MAHSTQALSTADRAGAPLRFTATKPSACLAEVSVAPSFDLGTVKSHIDRSHASLRASVGVDTEEEDVHEPHA